MDPINPNVNPNMNPGMPPRPASSGAGFIIATVILLVVILVAAIFFWKARSNGSFRGDAALEQIQNQSDSDTAAAIEADLNATDVDNVDYDLNESNFTAS